jgi:hypothetical protein
MSTGILTTAAWTEDLAVKSFAGSMVRLMPAGMATLFGMTSMLKTETALQTDHGFFSKTMIFPQLQLSVAATAADTSLTVFSTDNILPGHLFQAPGTSEQIMVENVVSSTSVAVRRGVGSISPGTIAINARLFQTGNAYEEGSNRPASLNINPVKITNLTAIFRNSWALTDTARSIPNIAGDSNIQESRQDCAMFHAVDIEKQLFFGQKSQGTKNGKPFRTMDGLISTVANLSYYPSSYSAVNVFTAGATTNFTQLQNFLEPCLNQSTDPKVGNERIVFTGGTGKRVMNDIGRVNGTYYLMDGQTNWGLQFSTFKTARGTFRVIEHPLFNSNASWAAMAVVLDLSTFSIAYLNDRKTQVRDYNMSGNIAADNGVDAVGGTLTTELTCLVKNPPANAIIYNLTAAAIG